MRERPLERPQAMRIDRGRCAGTGLCEHLAPLAIGNPDEIPVTRESLEAMASCPTGAITWCEPSETVGPGETVDPGGDEKPGYQ